MAETLSSAVAVDIGTADKVLHTATAKAIIIGGNFSNKTAFELPLTVWIERGTSVVTIVKDARVLGNQNTEIIKGKLVLEVGDVVKARCPLDNSFDGLLSYMAGIN